MSGFSRISGTARYQRNEWIFGLGLQIQPILSLAGGRPYVVSQSRFTPGNGGVKGTVYLDENGNGQRDDGEPGVAGIGVVAEGGRHATSGTHGEFLLGATSARRRMRVSLDVDELFGGVQRDERRAMGGD